MPVVAPVRAGNSKQGSASSLFSWGTETAHAAAGGHSADATGFTLIELVVVLAIAATVAVVMAPKLSNEAFMVGTQADRLANDIRYVQSLAMTQGQRYVLDLGAGPPYTGYTLKTSTGGAVRHPATGLTTALPFGGGVRAVSTANLSAGLIGFDGRGVPYTNSPFSALTVAASITLDSAGRQRVVSITPQTGRVALQ